MGRKNQWQIERDKVDALREKSMKSLTIDQLNAIKETHQTLADCLMMIRDCNDLYLSDTRKLDNVFWKLKNEFNLEEK
jgi:hypothetical protein|tara:strand:+ start:308 stop:541 length:234 start_codon:yes stop_codon:yes gene_type:complete